MTYVANLISPLPISNFNFDLYVLIYLKYVKISCFVFVDSMGFVNAFFNIV